MFNSNLPTNRSRGCALEKSVTVGNRLVLLLNAVFVYFTNLETFFQTFKIKNGTIEPGLKAHYTRKMKNPVTILRQENVEEVLCHRFSWNFEKNHFLFYRKHLIFQQLIRLSWKLILVMCSLYYMYHPPLNNWFIRQRAFIEIWSTQEVCRVQKIPIASYLDERTADVWTNCLKTFSTRWFKCCRRVTTPSVTLQRVDNFVSGKHFATLQMILS